MRGRGFPKVRRASREGCQETSFGKVSEYMGLEILRAPNPCLSVKPSHLSLSLHDIYNLYMRELIATS